GADHRSLYPGVPARDGVRRATMTTGPKNVPTDPSKFVPAEQMDFGQRPIDMKAPILLRPVGDDPTDKRNWVLKAIERTGQPLDAAIGTWAFGFALEDNLMWDAIVEHLGEEEARRSHAEVWRRIPEKY